MQLRIGYPPVSEFDTNVQKGMPGSTFGSLLIGNKKSSDLNTPWSAELISVFLKVLLRFRATWGRKHAGLASYTLVRVLGWGVAAGVTILEQFGKGWEG